MDCASEIASGERLRSAAPKIIEGFSGDDRLCATRKPDGFVGAWASTGRGVEEEDEGGVDCDFAGGMIVEWGMSDAESIECRCPKQNRKTENTPLSRTARASQTRHPLSSQLVGR
jgi:hypothetical protein